MEMAYRESQTLFPRSYVNPVQNPGEKQANPSKTDSDVPHGIINMHRSQQHSIGQNVSYWYYNNYNFPAYFLSLTQLLIFPMYVNTIASHVYSSLEWKIQEKQITNLFSAILKRRKVCLTVSIISLKSAWNQNLFFLFSYLYSSACYKRIIYAIHYFVKRKKKRICPACFCHAFVYSFS